MNKPAVTIISVVILILSCQVNKVVPANLHVENYVRSPFTGLDTLSTNDWWNRGPNEIIDLKVPRDQTVAFGLYTVQDQTLKLSAQLYPLYPEETRTVSLEIKIKGKWKELQRRQINDLGWSTTFRIEDWTYSTALPYRIRHGKNAFFEGIIRPDPINKDEIKVAALSCNSNKDRGNRDSYVENIKYQDADLLFFAGDQSYDHREHTAAWLKWGQQFKEIIRDRPTITIPDDHDIGQGNLWGENGKKANRIQGDDGGYYYHPEYVKMVERCQTAHLPDPADPAPIEQGIGVYFTRLIVGGVDFAIIEDRKFKSGPNGKIPLQGPRPDHIINPAYDPKSIDIEGLILLGERQLKFLDQWASLKEGVKMKAVLSQTGFCGGAHIHGSMDNRLHADLDSNGWPQRARNKALSLIKKANAVHIAGDQHLATVIRHGINEFRDGPWAFVVPAMVNNYYSRWWWPEDELPGSHPNPNTSLPWTGDYLDGFNNKISLMAYANPDAQDKGAGYGLIRFNKKTLQVTFECWPRYADVRSESAKQFEAWPITINMSANQ